MFGRMPRRPERPLGGAPRVGIDVAPLLLSSPTGVSRFAQSLVDRIPENDTVLVPFAAGRVRGVVDSTNQALHYPSTMRQRVLRQIRGRDAMRLWRKPSLAWPWLPRNIDLVHGINYRAPLSRNLPSLITVHDPYCFIDPRDAAAVILARDVRIQLESGAFVHAVSDACKQDLLMHVDIDPSRVSVIPHGSPDIDSAPVPLDQRAESFLFLGSVTHRKNVLELVKGFGIAIKEWPGIQMTIAGDTPDKSYAREVRSLVDRLGLSGDIQFFGYVSETERKRLLGGSRALLYPSIYEGFGMPVLEAMAASTPVLCTRAGGLEVTGGDAALYVDRDAASIADGIARLMDCETASKASKAGPIQAQRFSWHQATSSMSALYAQLAGGTT